MTATEPQQLRQGSTLERVRFRCLPCDVAWTADTDEDCWNCGKPGLTLRSALALREDDHLHLDFQ